MKRWLLVAISALSWLFFSQSLPDVVLACSGCVGCTWLDIANDLDENTIVVRGVGFIRGDEITVSVLEYLVGEPDLWFLRVYYAGNGHTSAALMGYYTGSCGQSGKYPASEAPAYYVMTRQQDGTYRIHHIISFPSERPQFIDTSVGREAYHLTETEFLARIEANPRPPLFMEYESRPSPLPGPGLIRTPDNDLYLLPVDARTAEDILLIAQAAQNVQIVDNFIGITTAEKLILHEVLSGFQWAWDRPNGVDCAMLDCIVFSDNGVVMTLQLDADTIQVCELALIYPNSNYVTQPTAEAPPCVRDRGAAFYDGAGVRISADSHHMAIWHGSQITIYGGLSWLNHLMWEENPVTITATTLDLPAEEAAADWFAGRGVWSQDSRWLAYSDQQGLWLWDVFTQRPQLFLPTSAEGVIPYARFFSQSGRYLAISLGEEHIIVDRFSDLTFPDGEIRPDDRMVLRRDTVNHLPVPAEICNLLDGQCTPLIESAPTTTIRNAYWLENGYRPHEWIPCGVATESLTALQDIGFCTGYQKDDYRIASSLYGLNIDTEGVLSGPIQTLTWFSR